MMDAIFIKILNMSISAGYLILAVLLLRLLLRKAPKWFYVLLWGLVGIRLIMPLSIESGLSLLPSAQIVSPSIGYEARPSITSGIPTFDNMVNPVLGNSLAADPYGSANPAQIWLFIGRVIWLAGVLILLIYSLISVLRLHRKVSEAILCQDNIWLCDHIPSPFILGVFRPRIYLPSGLDEKEMTYVLAHEQAHLKRKDHFWKPIGFLLLSIYWFNPLIWIAYILLCRDIEMACDEKVISNMEMQDKKAYANALVSCSMQRKLVMAYPLTFGEVGVKERVKGVLNYQKPAFWIIVVGILATIVVAVCFLTSPKSDELNVSSASYENAVSFDTGEYVSIEWQGRRYVPFCAVDNSDRGAMLAIVDGDDNNQLYEYKGYAPDKWIISFYHSGLMDGSMLMREEHVTEFPDSLDSEYSWNQID